MAESKLVLPSPPAISPLISPDEPTLRAVTALSSSRVDVLDIAISMTDSLTRVSEVSWATDGQCMLDWETHVY